jgi:hypothetical protein
VPDTQRTPGVAPGGRTLIFDERLPPGAYRLVSYQRPCAGNCDYLDPPTDRCETVLHLNDVEPPRGRLVEEEPAATYSPRPFQAKYHRRCGA